MGDGDGLDRGEGAEQKAATYVVDGGHRGEEKRRRLGPPVPHGDCVQRVRVATLPSSRRATGRHHAGAAAAAAKNVGNHVTQSPDVVQPL